jgi:hypothetical protein
VDTYIVRIHRGVQGEDLRGTVEIPGAERQPFTGSKALLRILTGSHTIQAGKASGSTSSSAMREA